MMIRTILLPTEPMRPLLSILALFIFLPVMLIAQKKPKGDEGPIRLGVILSFTGQLSNYAGDMYRGYQLALDEINGNGGIDGTRIELDTIDDGSRTGGVISAFERLAGGGVSAILGPVSSSGMIALSPLSRRRGIPIVSGSATNAHVTSDSNNLFRACFADPAQGRAMAMFARENLKVDRIAILTDNANAYSFDLALRFRERFTSLGGSVVSEGAYQSREEDYGPQLRSIAARNPQAIYVPGYYEDVRRIVVQARSLGIRVPILGGDGWDSPELFSAGGAVEALEGCYITNHFSADDPSPAVRRFASIYRTRFRTEPTAMAALGHDAVQMLVAAMRKAGSREPAAIRAALIGLTIDGVTGPITIGADRETTKPILVQKIEAGRMKFAARVPM